MQRVSFWVLVSLLNLFSVQTAAAGCPNKCDLKVEEAQIEPAVNCLAIDKPEADDCDCEVRLFVQNDCEQAVEPQDFSLTFCGNDVRECNVIEPEDYGVISIPLTEVGRHEHVFTVQIGETSAEITAVTEVEAFQEGGCSCAVQGRSAPAAPWVALSFAALGGVLTRRLRRVVGVRP